MRDVGEIRRVTLAGMEDDCHAALALTVTLPPEQLEALARRVAELLREDHDDGFLDVDGAAAFLGDGSRKRVYHLVERQQLPHHRVGGRLLFDRAELRDWVERGG